ncbi:MAG: substrate-binding domain-containing protein [Anaerolineae bacterium]|nr:substrate-binding domain-containing protein [Anaerolineae bacterium]
MLTKLDYGFAPSVSPFYSHIQAGIESECRKHQINLMFANVEVDASNRPVNWPAMIQEAHVDGLLLAGAFIEDAIGFLHRKLDIPMVLVDSYAANLLYDSVLIDNGPGTALAVNYLLELGHTNIGLIGTNPDSPPGVLERRQEFIRIIQGLGLSTAYVEESHLAPESGYDAIQQLMQRAPEVTAVFAGADVAAIGAIRGLSDMGLRIPEDVSVLGFDNIDAAAYMTPRLTTVHVHKTWMGAISVRQLLDRARHPEQPKVTISVATELVVRDSACSPRKT